MTDRHLDGIGKGEALYDYKYDIFTFRIKDRNYKKSVEFQNFVADIDDENFITGIRIFDASKVFNVKKILLKSIYHVDFKARLENNAVMITIKFVIMLRNRIIPLFSEKQNFTQQIITHVSPEYGLKDSLVEASVST